MAEAPAEGALVQDELDARNSVFWNTLCGTSLAQSLGITDDSSESLRKFDDWYFAFYPYLAEYIPFGELRGRCVLEVGLGYGTVSQRLAECGAEYTGLDIAENPVAMVNERLRRMGNNGRAQRGSILAAPFDDESFDCVVAIGCYHHTGNIQRALDESYRILRPGGSLVGMVYNGYSYRRWYNAGEATFRYLLWDFLRIGTSPIASADERMAYDNDTRGNEAPHTDFVSRRHLRRMCRRFAGFRAMLANIDQEKPFARRSRLELLATRWPRWCGLDIYFWARK
jgi:SAM-dependent methyltransferase